MVVVIPLRPVPDLTDYFDFVPGIVVGVEPAPVILPFCAVPSLLELLQYVLEAVVGIVGVVGVVGVVGSETRSPRFRAMCGPSTRGDLLELKSTLDVPGLA